MTFPTKKDLIAYIERENAVRKQPVDRREIARAFGIKGPARADLRALLKELEADGSLNLDGKKAKRPGQLPPVTILDVVSTDSEGDLVCVLPKVETEQKVILPSSQAAKAKPPIGVGDRFLGRLSESGGELRAKVVKAFGKSASRMLGVFTMDRNGGRVEPVSRKVKNALLVARGDTMDAENGDLVWAEAKPQKGYGPPRGRVTERLGSVDDAANLSLIALAEHDIRLDFPDRVIREANALDVEADPHHEDLRETPLVTIDPAEARDHDDAVFAEEKDDGFRLLVAIADVSYFVRPGTALDAEAERRGNSVYLPDRVVPMLPERLSNDLCSLREGEDRLALVCEIEIGKRGGKKSHRFFRAVIKNHKNLAYERAQAIEDGHEKGPKEVKTLFKAYRALMVARERREPLDLDMRERKLVMGKDGLIAGVTRKDRLDAHRLIEEFMVLANVCAAETLEERERTCVYRVHDRPDPERLDGLRLYLEGLGYTLPKGDEVRASNLNGVLQKAREKDELDIIAMSVLRAQSQAIYDTTNIGHFGLSLKRYAHFTSPIRRYADLTVHRGIVRGLGLGAGGVDDADEVRLPKIAEDISICERAAVSAERDTEARMLAAFLEEQTGAVFHGRISGVTRAGLFIALDETGADGFVPMRSLGWERFEHDEGKKALISEHSGAAYTLGQPVQVRLLEVTPLQGGLRFEMLSKPRQAKEDDAPKSRHQKAKAAAARASGKKPRKPKPKPAPAPAKLTRRPRKKR
ncbi:MAG: ribonuclease R [Pseudomonadota bacterium]